jgi:translation initiation factor IF-2
VSSLRRFKDDAREVQNGLECGIGVEGFSQFEEGDVIETFHTETKD